MTLERRIARAERVLKMFVRSGRKYRRQFRENVQMLIHMQMRDNDEWRARHRAMDEKINILINAQIATDEQMKRTDEQMKRTDEQIKRTDEQIEALTARQAKTDETLDRLAVSQAKTDQTLERFINSLSKGRNGNSSD
jgi:septal ring factor EnvC (AmiA/AmiB activator)